jgi:hypothetical protein
MKFGAFLFLMAVVAVLVAGVAADIWLWQQLGWKGVGVLAFQEVVVQPVVSLLAEVVLLALGG